MPRFRVIAFRGKFAAEWTDAHGKRRRRSLGTDDPRQVDAQLVKLGAEIEAANRPAVISVQHAWDRYRAQLGERPAGASMDYAWRALRPFFGGLPADAVTEAHCRAYIDARKAAGRRDSTIWLDLSRLRSALLWAEHKGLITRAPFIWRPNAPEPRDKRLTREQAARYIEACVTPHLRLFVILALMTGARRQALLDLTWNRVDFERGQIDLRDPTRLRGKRRPLVAMNETARKELLEARRGATTPYVIEWGGKKVTNIKQGLRRCGARCGMLWVSAHTFRHSAASWMAEGGISMAEIAQFLGHKDSRITERVYAKYGPTYLRRPAAVLELDHQQDKQDVSPDTADVPETTTNIVQIKPSIRKAS
jgi:integrase